MLVLLLTSLLNGQPIVVAIILLIPLDYAGFIARGTFQVTAKLPAVYITSFRYGNGRKASAGPPDAAFTEQ